MTESYKYKSKLATAIGGICTIISVLGVEQLAAMFPGYGQYIPAIVALATWYISQTTENTRVEVAEQIIREQYLGTEIRNIDPASEYETAGDTDDQ